MTEPLIPLGLAKDTTVREMLSRLELSLETSDSESHAALQAMVSGLEAGIHVANFPATQPVSISSLPLPSGAATQTTLANTLTRLESILSKLEGTINVNAPSLPLPVGAATQTTLANTLVKLEGILSRLEGTLPVSAASLPLPTGAATQTTLAGTLTKLESILTRLEGTLSISAASLPLPAGAATQTTLASALTRLESILSKLEGTLSVSAASLPLPAGAATQSTLATSVTKLEVIISKLEGTLAISAASLPLPSGAATQTTLASVLSALQGSLTVNQAGYSGKVITTAATTKVKESSGVLHTITILGGIAGSITAYDNTKAEGTVLVPVFTLLSIGTPFTLTFDSSFSNGLTIVTGAATAMQVSYR